MLTMLKIKTTTAPIVSKFLDPPLKKIDFCFYYAPDCTHSNLNFQQIYGERLTEPPPQTPPHSISVSVLESSSASNHPLTISHNRRGLDQTLFAPASTFWLCQCPV